MELPNVGQQCSKMHCKQLDFLPLKCQCGLTFCSKHFNEHSDKCAVLQKFNVPNLECTPPVYVCNYSNCDNRSYVSLLCETCNRHFCITHRHLDNCHKTDIDNAEIQKFKESNKQFEEAKAIIDKQLDNSIDLAKKKTRTENLANKVYLMRIKNKATGLKSIPTEERAYFNITLPSVKGSKESPIFVSKQWTLGRVIDAVAIEAQVPNKNNQNAAPKLRLFHKSSREIVFTELGAKLEELLINKVVSDGEDLVLEYVSDECTTLFK